MIRAALLALALLLTGCTSSGSGTTSSVPPSTGPSSSALATKLAATLRSATRSLTSAHITVDAGALGGTATGNVSFHDGTTTASDITLDLAGKTRIVTVGDTSWAMLPKGRNTSGKPWVVVSADTSNEFVRALVSQVGVIKAAISVPQIADVVSGASSVRDLGTASQGHHYALLLPINKIKGSELGAQLATLGTDPLPVDLYLDQKGRPVYVKLAAKIGSQPLPIAVTAGSFDVPVQISAPPPDEVAS
jgi:hypothetical protein